MRKTIFIALLFQRYQARAEDLFFKNLVIFVVVIITAYLQSIFTGDILLENQGMQAVCKNLGITLRYSPEDNLMNAELEL